MSDQSGRPSSHVPTSGSAESRKESHYWQYCVNFGTLLEGRRCKLICPACGFYRSCSEP